MLAWELPTFANAKGGLNYFLSVVKSFVSDIALLIKSTLLLSTFLFGSSIRSATDIRVSVTIFTIEILDLSCSCIYDPVKHVRWSFLQKQLTAFISALDYIHKELDLKHLKGYRISLWRVCSVSIDANILECFGSIFSVNEFLKNGKSLSTSNYCSLEVHLFSYL